MKEFVKYSDACAKRPVLNFMKIFYDGNYGLIFSDDSFWKNQRNFTLHVLRDLGKSGLEETAINQADQMIKALKELNGKPIEMTKILTTVVGNNIYQLAFGWTFPLEDDYIMNFRNKLSEVLDVMVHPIGLLFEIWEGFKFADPLFDHFMKKSLKKNDEIKNDIKQEIKKHRETIDYNSKPRDYIDAFLIEQRRQNIENGVHGEWSDNQLVAAVCDLFSGGMETISNSIRAFILYMINYPGIQKKIHEEIDREIGREKVITMSDKVKLPYLQSCIEELQRIFVPASLNIQHKTTGEVIIGGYKLPEGTTIIPQFFSIHLDEDHFADPERFDPTRYLDKENRFVKNSKITPFSLGKRACPGENMARMNMFLLIANLFQKFEFKEEIEGKYPEIKFISGVLKSPDVFYTRLIYRE
ncbi:hypothetical protein FO519_009280 [Halicephalobus sp. NKZ332]|nr:hypothetical protein FO519_009280 [Halicephalobus sp. NKZ332]